MKKLLAVGAIVVVGMSLAAEDAFARRGGGQQGMRGGQSASSYGYNYQTLGMQQHQMRNQYRNRYGGFGLQNGSYQYQWGPNHQGRLPQQGAMHLQMNGPQGGMGNQKRMMYQQGMQNGARSGQAGNGARNGAGQKQMNQQQLQGVQPNGENQ